MTKVFLIGGAGFIGSNIARNLIKKGDEVIVYDGFLNFLDPLKGNYQKYLDYRLKDIKEDITLIRGDIRHKSHLRRALYEHRPSKVVCLAALPIATVANKFSEEATDINFNGTMNVLEAMRGWDFIDHFIYTSSSMIYGNFQYDPADEEHPCNPICVYGGTKLAGEILTKVFSKQYGMDYTIIRPSAVYGPGDVNYRVSQIFVENALQRKPLTLHNEGRSRLDFTYVKDIANGFVLALKNDGARNETFNMTRGKSRSLKEFVDVLKNLISGLEIREEPVPEDEKRPERGALSIEKAKNLLGYNPEYDLEDGLKEYVDFVKEMNK